MVNQNGCSLRQMVKSRRTKAKDYQEETGAEGENNETQKATCKDKNQWGVSFPHRIL